jgi:flagellar protein FlaI
MAIDEADQSDTGDFSEGEGSDPEPADERSRGTEPESRSTVRVGEYTWKEFMNEYGHGDDASVLYSAGSDLAESGDQLGLDTNEGGGSTPGGADWDRVEFDPESYLGHDPDELEDTVLPTAGDRAATLQERFLEFVDPETTPVVKDLWSWEHYKREYYYEDDGSRPRDADGEVVPHDEADALGFDPDTLENRLAAGDDVALALDDVVEERTVNVREELDEDEFFSTTAGNTTVSNRYDLEKAVPLEKKTHFREVERYWVNKPYAYVVIFHSERENEKKYYMIEPHQNEIEAELKEFLSGKLRTAIKYSDEGVKGQETESGRQTVIEDETRRLLKRYDLFEAAAEESSAGVLETLRGLLGDDDDADDADDGPSQLGGIEIRPEPIVLEEDPDTLSEYQVEKLLYLLKRDFIGYERIDGIKHDINVEDISCNGYNSPVFVYHSEYEQIITNIYHGEDELDDFVVKLAQRSGKGISKRLPQVDATLPDGSRAQLTLGQEVSDHGTNYTIRQFKDVPFTPIDLINWNTFSLDEMAFLWLCIENHKSLIFAGGTASGKTTSLNAVSLFIPSNAKIVSIEDTREVELPQRNWIASVTRPSFSDDEQGDVDEFDLLEAALRQRPDYIVMGEIRGEEGRTLFQVMSTGHTTYTTFHADSVDEVLKRFTTDPINVSKTMFTALDLVSIQTQTRVQGNKVRRNKALTEINHYDAEHDEINVQDVYQWQAETDEFLKMGDSNTLEGIQFDRGWNREKLEDELFKRKTILAYLIKNGLNTYTQVAATIQAFINDPDTILTLIANGQLEESLESLREMESVLIEVEQEKEELVPRPEATDETYNLSTDILERAEESMFDEYRGEVPSGLDSALDAIEGDAEPTIEVDRADSEEFDFGGDVDRGVDEANWDLGDSSTEFTVESGDDGGEPAWLSDDAGFDAEGDPEAAADAADGGGEMPAPEPDTGTTDDEATTGGDAGGAPEPVDGGADDEPPDATAADATDAGPSDSSRSPATGERSGPSPGSARDESTATSSDENLEGLFDDMGETIDEIGAAGDGARANGADGESGGSDSDTIDSMFPEDELDSIFDPDSPDDRDADDTGAAATNPSAPADDGARSPDASTDTRPSETGDADAPGEPVAAEPIDDSDDESEADAEPATSTAEVETPTIDLESESRSGTDDDSPPGDEGTDAPEREPDPGGSESGSSEPSDPEPPTIDLGGAAVSPDDSGDDDSTTEAEPVPDDGDEPTGEADRSVGEQSADDSAQNGTESDDGSIFGGESESIFSDEDEVDDDDGSLFDGNDADAEESIFESGADEEATEVESGTDIFDADDEGDDA